jgi:hypothetical protein
MWGYALSGGHRTRPSTVYGCMPVKGFSALPNHISYRPLTPPTSRNPQVDLALAVEQRHACPGLAGVWPPAPTAAFRHNAGKGRVGWFVRFLSRIRTACSVYTFQVQLH